MQSQVEAERYQVFIPQQKSVSREVAVAREGGALFCDCLMHNTCGITCAHSLVVLKHLKQRLFHRNFFHSRWDRVTQVEFDTSVTGYKPQILHPSIIGEFPSNAPECSELADFEAESDSAHVEEPDIDLPTHHAQEHDAQVVPPQLGGSIVDNNPSKNAPLHNRYVPQHTSVQPSYSSLMKRCQELCRYTACVFQMP